MAPHDPSHFLRNAFPQAVVETILLEFEVVRQGDQRLPLTGCLRIGLVGIGLHVTAAAAYRHVGYVSERGYARVVDVPQSDVLSTYWFGLDFVRIVDEYVVFRVERKIVLVKTIGYLLVNGGLF